MKAIAVTPQAGDLQINSAQTIKPESKGESVLSQRMNWLDGNKIPPLSSHVVDREAVNSIGQWIDM